MDIYIILLVLKNVKKKKGRALRSDARPTGIQEVIGLIRHITATFFCGVWS